MTVDYSVHSLDAAIVQGQLAPAPPLLATGQKSLAVDTNSAVITGPCVILLTSVGKKRLDVRRETDAGALDPANSPLILPNDQQVPYTLPRGRFILKTTAWLA